MEYNLDRGSEFSEITGLIFIFQESLQNEILDMLFVTKFWGTISFSQELAMGYFCCYKQA